MSEYEFPYYTIAKCPSCGKETEIKHSHKIPNGKLGNCRICRKNFLLIDNNVARNVERSD